MSSNPFSVTLPLPESEPMEPDPVDHPPPLSVTRPADDTLVVFTVPLVTTRAPDPVSELILTVVGGARLITSVASLVTLAPAEKAPVVPLPMCRADPGIGGITT